MSSQPQSINQHMLGIDDWGKTSGIWGFPSTGPSPVVSGLWCNWCPISQFNMYFPSDHPTHPGLFKGMAMILEEHSFVGVHSLWAECIGFKCLKDPDGEYGHCCCHHILFNQPNFTNVPSLLSTLCMENGIPAAFLPKFSPELNPIEQCWGYAKRIYRECPPSSAINDVIKNARMALTAVPLSCIRK